jgi:hypothetical protein
MVEETLEKLVFGSESIQIRIDLDLFKPDPVPNENADLDPTIVKKVKTFIRSNQIILINNFSECACTNLVKF